MLPSLRINARRTRLTPDDRRDLLVRTALALFSADGVASTSILRITQIAGVSNGTFYHYFASKDEIEDAVGEVVIADLTAKLAVLQSAEECGIRVAVGAFGTMHAVASNRQLGALLAQYLEERNELLQRSGLQVEADIAAGAASGEFQLDAPINLVVGMVISTLAVGAREVLAGSPPDDVGIALAAAHLRMLGTPRVRARQFAMRVQRMSLATKMCD